MKDAVLVLGPYGYSAGLVLLESDPRWFLSGTSGRHRSAAVGPRMCREVVSVLLRICLYEILNRSIQGIVGSEIGGRNSLELHSRNASTVMSVLPRAAALQFGLFA